MTKFDFHAWDKNTGLLGEGLCLFEPKKEIPILLIIQYLVSLHLIIYVHFVANSMVGIILLVAVYFYSVVS